MTGLASPPLPTIRRRQQVRTVQDAASAAGYTPLQQRILAGRLSAHQAAEIRRAVRPQVADLDHYGTLPDIDRAAERLVREERLLGHWSICRQPEFVRRKSRRNAERPSASARQAARLLM